MIPGRTVEKAEYGKIMLIYSCGVYGSDMMI